MNPAKSLSYVWSEKGPYKGVLQAALSLIYTSRSRTHLSSIQIPVQHTVNDTTLHSCNSLHSLLLQTQSHLNQNVIRYNLEDLPAYVKWNTKLMQHCAGFISAESLYMFRASSAHHQEYLKTSTAATGTCVIVAGKSSHLLIRAESNETPNWCNTVQVLFLQSHSTCFGRKHPSSGVFKN